MEALTLEKGVDLHYLDGREEETERYWPNLSRGVGILRSFILQVSWRQLDNDV